MPVVAGALTEKVREREREGRIRVSLLTVAPPVVKIVTVSD